MKKRIIRVKIPSRVRIVKKKKKPQIAKCALCKSPLQGIKRYTQSQLRNIPKSKKRPNRLYGGFLCSRCIRKKIIERARKNV